jgi:hypothetical protein
MTGSLTPISSSWRKVPGGGGSLFFRVKRPGHEADYSSPSSAQFRNAWTYICTPPPPNTRLHGVVPDYSLCNFLDSLACGFSQRHSILRRDLEAVGFFYTRGRSQKISL